MNPRNTWKWIGLAVVLFAFIFIFERHWQQAAPGLGPLLPDFKASAVTSVKVRPANIPEIRAERTNSTWSLFQPLKFPANPARIEALLAALEHLTPVTVLTAAELKRRPQAEAEFGFDAPQSSVEIQQADSRMQLKFGSPTAPGDQVMVQVVGGVDIFVVDAEILKLLPESVNDWRDPALLDLRPLVFDRISITNAGKVIALQRDPASQLWRIAEPLSARADLRHILVSLQKLQGLGISEFVLDHPAPDLDPFGLTAPGLSLAFSRGTNSVALLQFGRTNAAGQVFARRVGVPSIVTVDPEPLAPWHEQFYEFRDLQLLALPSDLREVEVRAAEHFILQRDATNTWRVASEKFPVDSALVNDFLATLARLEIAQFVQDAVLNPDLARYGLTSPVYQVTFPAPAAAGVTNPPLAHLAFGTVAGENVYVRRADEDSVYAVKLADFQTLPSAGWQLRQRRLWSFVGNDLARVVIRESGKVRELIRNGTNSWAFAPGSQGIVNGLAVEQAVGGFGDATAPSWATAWVARGEAARDARYGFTTNALTLAFELKSGEKLDVQFGGLSPAQYPYARVTLEGEPWVLEFSRTLFELVLNYLTIPANVP